jgi:hypothetical protein
VFLAHLFLLGLRKEFSVDFENLSPLVCEIYQDSELAKQGKVAILTLESLRELITYMVLNPIEAISKAITTLKYRLRNYSKVFLSYWKKYFRSLYHSFEQADTG